MRFITTELVASFNRLGVELSAAPGFYESDGVAKQAGITEKDVDPAEFAVGMEHEKEHTADVAIRTRLVLDHLAEFTHYYTEILFPAEKDAKDGTLGTVRLEAKLKQVAPDKLIGLHDVDAEALKVLSDAIAANGYLKENPVLVVETPLGFLVLDGNHRGSVAKELNLKSIPALVVDWEEFTNLLLLRFNNVMPKKARVLDKFIFVDGKPYSARASHGGASGSTGTSSGSTSSTGTSSTGTSTGSTGTTGAKSSATSAETITCQCTCSVVENSIEFCGQQYVPDQAKAYVIATMLTSFPAFTKTRRAWTAATISNSAVSAHDQVLDREHNLLFYKAQRGSTKDDVVGHIVCADFPTKKKAMELAAKGEGIPFKVLVCLSRKISGVEQMLEEIPNGIWKLSQECEYNREESAFYDCEDKKFYPYAECSDVMKAILQRNTVADWNGHKMLFCPGGEDGEVLFSGCAMTRWPLDVTAKTESIAAAEVRPLVGLNYKDHANMKLTNLFESLTCAEAWRGDNVPDDMFAYVPAEAKGKNGKKSLRKFPLGSSSRKGLDPAILRNALSRFSQADLPVSAKAGVKSKILAAIKRWNAAHPGQKIEASEKSGGQEFEVSGCMFAGCTMAAEYPSGKNDGTTENHTHSIMSNGTVMPTGGHYHGLEILSIDLGAGELCAVTTCAYDYLSQPSVPGEAAVCGGPPSRTREYAHRHIVRLTKDSISSGETDVTGAITTAMSGQVQAEVKGDVSMKIQEKCAGLRTRAASLKETAPEVSAELEQMAAELEKEVSADNVETAIAAKVKDGVLVTKEVHEQAVSAAKQAGKDELQKEISAQQELAAKQAEATKTRIASVVSAGFKPETPLGKDRTIASEVSAMPAGEDGDKLFASRLEEWTALKAAAAVPAPKNASAASAGTPNTHMLGAPETIVKPAEVKQLSKEDRRLAIL